MSQKEALSSSLWEYALRAYQRPPMAETCLALQDRFSADVNLLLAAGWLASRRIIWQREAFAVLVELCADWRTQCLLPLRAVRRYLRNRGVESDVLSGLYQQGKAMELEAERYQLSMIEAAINASTLVQTDALQLDVLTTNLDGYLALLPADPSCYRIERDTLLAALSEI